MQLLYSVFVSVADSVSTLSVHLPVEVEASPALAEAVSVLPVQDPIPDSNLPVNDPRPTIERVDSSVLSLGETEKATDNAEAGGQGKGNGSIKDKGGGTTCCFVLFYPHKQKQ